MDVIFNIVKGPLDRSRAQGAPEDLRNALRHGPYTDEAAAERRKLAATPVRDRSELVIGGLSVAPDWNDRLGS